MMSSLTNGFIVFSLFMTLIYFIGVLVFVTDHEKNRCDMTYMFEYPQFVRISNEFDQRYPKYGLYAYSEGRRTEQTRDMYFDGIPVIFIPGNGGSSKQVRSLASIALRKAVNSRTPFHFDYFTIDLNSEHSGLNGALLQEQVQYVNFSLYRVLDLYEHGKNPQKSVILFGHSMGGVIARHLVSKLPPESRLVPIVLTLASPHKRVPLMLDSYSHEFYKDMGRSVPDNTLLVSVSGGYNDFLVATYLSELPDNNSLNVVTTHVPLSWLPIDHVCILWCKQTILSVNRALFESVDPKTKYISTDLQHIKMVFHHHLVHHSGTKTHLRHVYSLSPNIRNDGQWIESLYRQYSVILNEGVKVAHWYMIRLLDQPQHEMLTIVTLNMETVDWVYACGAHIPRGSNRVCEEFSHLTHKSEISPSVRYKRRTLRVNLHELIKNNSLFTHVVVRVLPTSEPVILHFDVYNSGDRRTTVTLPNLLSFKRQIIFEKTPDKAISLDLSLPGLQHVIQAYRLHVETLKCSNEFNHATASLKVPWGNEDYHKFFTDADNKAMLIRLHSPKDPKFANESATIQLTLDPSCHYRISIQSSIVDTLGQMARFYSPLLLVNVAAVILMVLNFQLKSISENRMCSMFFVAVKDGAKPYYILTSVKLLSRFLSVNSRIAVPDWTILSQEGTDFFLLPLVLYICSVGIVWILGVVLAGSVVLFETTVHKFVLRFLAKTVSFTFSWSDYFVTALHKLPFIVAGTLVFISMTTTGGLALCLGVIFYFMRLTQLSQDYVEELVWNLLRKLRKKFRAPKNQTDPSSQDKSCGEKEDEPKNKDKRSDSAETASAHNALFFHATLFMIWSVLAFLNLPSVLTWAHNFKYSTGLRPDPAFFPGLVLSICALPLWQLELPKVRRKWYKEVSQIVIFLAVVSLIYAPVSIFRLNYTLTAVIMVITVHQVVGIDVEEVSDDHTGRENNENPSYDSVKAKWE